MNDKTFKTVKTVATLIPAALIAFIMFLNAVPDFYTQRNQSTLQAFIDNPPSGYKNNMDETKPHGSLTGGCGLLSPTRDYCQYGETVVSFYKDTPEWNAKECQQFIDWAKERGAQYLNYGGVFVKVEGAEDFVQRICVTTNSVSLMGKLKHDFWQSDFSMGMIQVMDVQIPSDELKSSTVDIAELPSKLGESYIPLQTVLNKVGNFQFKNKIKGRLTKKQVSQALGNLSKDWLSLPGSDGKVLYLEGQSVENKDSKLCLVIKPYNSEQIGIPDTGKDYWPVPWTAGNSFGEFTTDRCPVD
jgi:hypothetical protein